jgi:subtilisin family serine protease
MRSDGGARWALLAAAVAAAAVTGGVVAIDRSGPVRPAAAARHTATRPVRPPTDAAVRSLLARRAEAVRDRDLGAWLATWSRPVPSSSRGRLAQWPSDAAETCWW